ncbi:MAG: hypothetical protein PVF82_17605 [Gammaproteobacteria bacterium]
MARLTRFFIKDQPQHIIQRGNNKDIIFAHDGGYRFYLKCLAEAAERHSLKIHIYVLMTNHFLCEALHKKWLDITEYAAILMANTSVSCFKRSTIHCLLWS